MAGGQGLSLGYCESVTSAWLLSYKTNENRTKELPSCSISYLYLLFKSSVTLVICGTETRTVVSRVGFQPGVPK